MLNSKHEMLTEVRLKPFDWLISANQEDVNIQGLSLLENNDKCNLNWSLWGASHIGQAKLVDCNQIQSHVVIAVFQ